MNRIFFFHSFSSSCQCFSFVFYSHCHNRIFAFIAIFFQNKIYKMCNCAWISIVKTQLVKSQHIWILIRTYWKSATYTHIRIFTQTKYTNSQQCRFNKMNENGLRCGTNGMIISFEMSAIADNNIIHTDTYVCSIHI